MSNVFNLTKLAGHKLLVKGDAGQMTVLDTQEWDGISAIADVHTAQEKYDKTVEDFFAPLIEAGAELEALDSGVVQDPAFVVTLHEGVEGVESKEAVQLLLSNEATIVRLLVTGDTERLIWVSNSEIAILALDTEVAAEAVSD